ncbi:prostatic acid phosphatase-like [Oppia nitens]|uniref:prostatic acid phosphatase-like n=1 Tax=Oppia nitens TaxID=1686743 RepID=UPI0023DCC047|nr:prostatic acid phosphatase-like [Oppia nitens]
MNCYNYYLATLLLLLLVLSSWTVSSQSPEINDEIVGTNCNIQLPARPTANAHTLEGLFILMRHGIRAPWTTYPLDPFANETNRFPNGGSQLTDAGINQAYNMGKYYKILYNKFIRANQKQSYLRASAAQRCIDTLAIVTKTLWPPNAYNEKSWQPMLFSLPKRIDSVLYEEPDCQPAEDAEHENLETKVVKDYEADPKIQKLYQLVANKTGLKPDMYSMTKAFDCFRCEKLNGLPSPKWVTPDLYDQMGDVLSHRLNFFYQSTKAQRLRAGPILEDFIEHMNKITNAKPGDKPKRLLIYTSHDFKIAALLAAIGDPQPKYPPFAAALIFELHKVDGKHIVRSQYVDQNTHWPYSAIKIPLSKCKKLAGESSTECSLDNFVQSVSNLEPVDWPVECKLNCTYNAFQVAEDNLGNT